MLATITATQEPNPFELAPRTEGAFAFKPMSIFSLPDLYIDRLKLLAAMFTESTAIKPSDQLKTNADFFLVMLKGLEIGIPPMSAVDYIDVIKGKPALSGKGMLALIQGSPACEDVFVEDFPDHAICTMKRKGRSQPYVVRFGKAEADQMMVYEKGNMIPLSQKANYKYQPLVMWRWRAISACARLAFPDVIGGMYLAEELNPDISVNSDGEIVESTAQPAQPVQKSSGSKPNNVVDLEQKKEDQQPEPEQPSEGQDEQDEQGEDPKPKTWLQEDEHKAWLLKTLKDNNLTADFFKKIDANATGWNDIAKKYKDRQALEKAISDAMGTDEEPAYVNSFDDVEVISKLGEKWKDESYADICNIFESYFDEDAHELITVGMATEEPQKEYSSPCELWRAMIDYAAETKVSLICNEFLYKKHGKAGRIETHHPILAICFSRSDFVKLIGEKTFTDQANISKWDENEGKPYKLHRDLIISYDTQHRKDDGKSYHVITSASIKQLDATDLDDLFD